MLQEIETKVQSETIVLSQAAAEAVRDILTQRNLDGYALRVYVAGGGCCSVQFGMALDNNVRGNDFKFESNGVNVLVDDQSMNYLRGAKVDFVNDPARGAGFVVDSPSAQKEGGACACGSSSHGHAEDEGSSCACGGSCGCSN
jgi:iron-sulfur cluster assembly protein